MKPSAARSLSDVPEQATPKTSKVNRATQQRGQEGETLAARFLESRGFLIVERNWRAGNTLRGEVDIIAWHHERHSKVLCFIEVKTRSSDGHGAPQEAVTNTKQRQLSRLANAYVSLNAIEMPCRFDVVEVWLPSDGTLPRIVLHSNAFDYQGF
jgi:putative endonuclease